MPFHAFFIVMRARFAEALSSCTETMMRNIVYDCADDDEDGVLIVPTRFVLRRTADPDLDAEDEAGAGGTTGSGTMNSGDSTTVRLSMPERETLGGDDADGSTADLTESVAGGDSSEVVLTTNSPTFALRRESAAPGLPWSRALPPRTTTVVVDRKTLLKDSVHNLARRLVANRPAHDTVQAARERIFSAPDPPARIGASLSPGPRADPASK